jgi:MOSC domain-containing protein YiiM
MIQKVEAICAGQPQLFRDEEKSAISKQPVIGEVSIGIEGLTCDAQADQKNHGGPHMAVHLYPRVHREFWRDSIGAHPLLDAPGAFGTNLAVDTIDERQVFLGDRFLLGTALLEVSQPRMPCWKIERIFDRSGMVAQIIKTGRCGWYFRVIEQGVAQVGDKLERVEDNRSPWSIADICHEIAYPKAKTTAERIAAMAECDLLGPSWRNGAGKKLAALVS